MSVPKPAQGQEHCGARRRDGSGSTCHLPAGWGTDHLGIGPCRKHLGTTPAHQARARRVLAGQAAEQFGLRVVTTAPAALQAELERSAGIVEFLVAQCAALPPAELAWGVAESRTGPDGNVVVQRAGPSVWLQLLERWSRHHADVAAVMARLDIDARQVSLNELFGDPAG